MPMTEGPKTEGALSEDDAVLAGELALGVLEGDELAQAQRRRIADPAFWARSRPKPAAR